MAYYQNGCLVCGKELFYFDEEKEVECEFCHKHFQTHVTCIDGHFICDECHAKHGLDIIKKTCLETNSKNPFMIAEKCMDQPYIHMHGPEHHVLVASVLLTAYYHAGGSIDLNKALEEAQKRGKEVPGGACGLWGCCGAAISAGIFVSIITHATPLSQKEWGYANLMTSQSLKKIGEVGGPRCCKRDSFLSILSAVDFVEKHFHIKMEKENVICHYFVQNRQCLQEKCPFYPQYIKKKCTNNKK